MIKELALVLFLIGLIVAMYMMSRPDKGPYLRHERGARTKPPDNIFRAAGELIRSLRAGAMGWYRSWRKQHSDNNK